MTRENSSQNTQKEKDQPERSSCIPRSLSAARSKARALAFRFRRRRRENRRFSFFSGVHASMCAHTTRLRCHILHRHPHHSGSHLCVAGRGSLFRIHQYSMLRAACRSTRARVNGAPLHVPSLTPFLVTSSPGLATSSASCPPWQSGAQSCRISPPSMRRRHRPAPPRGLNTPPSETTRRPHC